jgi:hypothetical protein
MISGIADLSLPQAVVDARNVTSAAPFVEAVQLGGLLAIAVAVFQTLHGITSRKLREFP